MNSHQLNMYVAKFKEQMTFDTKKQEYNFKTKMNEYSTRDTFNLAYELFKLCIEKDKQNQELKEGIIGSLKGQNINENTDHLIDTIADVVNENEELKREVKEYENIKTHDTLAFFNPPAAKLYEQLQKENKKLKRGIDKCLEVMKMTEQEIKSDKLSE